MRILVTRGDMAALERHVGITNICFLLKEKSTRLMTLSIT